MDKLGKKWFENINMGDTVRFITPYGERLIWELPGSTQIVCHLKVQILSMSRNPGDEMMIL